MGPQPLLPIFVCLELLPLLVPRSSWPPLIVQLVLFVPRIFDAALSFSLTWRIPVERLPCYICLLFFSQECPIHFNFPFSMLCAMLFCWVFFHRSLFDIISGHLIPRICQSHLLTSVLFVCIQVSVPHSNTELTLVFNILTFILHRSLVEFHMGFSVAKTYPWPCLFLP